MASATHGHATPLASVSTPNGACAGRRPRPEVACARLGTLYRRGEQSGERHGSGKGDWANGEVDEGARDWLAETTRLGAARADCAGVADCSGVGAGPGGARCGLVANRSGRAAPDARTAGIPGRAVQFSASDGVKLSGWLAIASPDSPTIILGHGFKATRVSMLPWAQFLYAANFNVLLYDSRGCGASAGWGIGVGASEPDDIVGATRFLLGYHGLTNKRFGALGVSLGAADALLAAARDPSLLAVIVDSP